MCDFKRVESLFSTALGSSEGENHQSQMFFRLVFLLQDTRAGEPHMGLISLATWGEPLQL